MAQGHRILFCCECVLQKRESVSVASDTLHTAITRFFFSGLCGAIVRAHAYLFGAGAGDADAGDDDDDDARRRMRWLQCVQLQICTLVILTATTKGDALARGAMRRRRRQSANAAFCESAPS